jgi:hypothetical protein
MVTGIRMTTDMARTATGSFVRDQIGGATWAVRLFPLRVLGKFCTGSRPALYPNHPGARPEQHCGQLKRLRTRHITGRFKPTEENTRYVLRSCSRYILLGCRPFCTLKASQNRRFKAVESRRQLKNRMQTENSPAVELFLRCLSSCSPIEYSGSSYEIDSVCFGKIARQLPAGQVYGKNLPAERH